MVFDFNMSQSFENNVFFDKPHVLIMAGGFGKRLAPLTDNIPKPMLDVAGKPFLERIIEKLALLEIRSISISTHFMADVIKDYFDDGARWGVNIDYIHENLPLGTGGALGLLPDSIDKDLLMLNGDILTEIDIPKFLAFHQKNKAKITIATRNYDYEFPYGVVDIDNQSKITALVEKPITTYSISGGVYVLHKDVHQNVPKGEKYDVTEIIERYIRNKENVMSFKAEGFWLDIGRKSDYEKANAYYKDK